MIYIDIYSLDSGIICVSVRQNISVCECMCRSVLVVSEAKVVLVKETDRVKYLEEGVSDRSVVEE